jgi:hypothetical protein
MRLSRRTRSDVPDHIAVRAAGGAFRAPYTSPDTDFTILRVTDGAVFSIVTVAEGKRSSGVMSFLERQFGSEQTTRTWNTVQRVLQAGKVATSAPTWALVTEYVQAVGERRFDRFEALLHPGVGFGGATADELRGAPAVAEGFRRLGPIIARNDIR